MGKIFIMSSVHNWNDTRVFHKEATSLAKKYNVELHAIANFKKKKIDGIDVNGLPDYNNRFLRLLNWIRLFYRIIRSKSKVIHFHDPELIILGLFFKLFTTKKVVYDIHEDYTRAILSKKWLGNLWFRKKISNIFNLIETKVSSLFDLNILVLDKWSERYENGLVVKNYPIVEDLNFNDLKKEKHIVYIGSLSRIRAIEIMIDSFNSISTNDIIFDLIGKWNNEKLKEEIMPKIKANKNINYLGYLPIDEAKTHLKKAKLGFCLYTNKNYEENIPVKMYEYLAYGTPVLYSDFESWKNKIQKEGWGISVNPLNKMEIANTIDNYFLNNKFEKHYLNCLKYRGKYNWKNEERKLLKGYNDILKSEVNND